MNCLSVPESNPLVRHRAGILDRDWRRVNPLCPRIRHPLCSRARERDGKEAVINGSVSLFDLGKRSVESQYGDCSDPWVRIRLMEHIK